MIDDHLYMPLQRMYNGAAQYKFHATELSIVHQLLPNISQIAEEVSWELVWEMLKLLEDKISDQLTLSQYKVYFPYF